MILELKKCNVIKNNSIKIFCLFKYLIDIEFRYYFYIFIDKCCYVVKFCYFNFK